MSRAERAGAGALSANQPVDRAAARQQVQLAASVLAERHELGHPEAFAAVACGLAVTNAHAPDPSCAEVTVEVAPARRGDPRPAVDEAAGNRATEQPSVWL